jgi:hypothetical protein
MKYAIGQEECRKISNRIYESGKGQIIDVIISSDEIIMIYKDSNEIDRV